MGPVTVTCPLCGYRSTGEEQVQACVRCPLSRGCRFVCCPHCSYQWTDQSLLLGWLKSRHARPKPTSGPG
ncbi:MAG TPA: hypothetical protein VGB20_04390 [bacterium]